LARPFDIRASSLKIARSDAGLSNQTLALKLAF
jgi:hypothetical protein